MVWPWISMPAVGWSRPSYSESAGRLHADEVAHDRIRSHRLRRRKTMIDHVTANVGDFEQAKHFYEQALAPLGYSLQVEFEGAVGFGTGEGVPDFWIGSSPERGAAPVAFSAKDRPAV